MKSKGLRLLLVLVLALLVGHSAALTAAPPPYLTYQGHLYASAGLPAANGDYSGAFSLWANGIGGEIPLWGPEKHTLTVQHGYFAVTLGTQEDLPALPSPVYLEITINGETLSPRQPLQSVAFALNAGAAEAAQDSVLLAGRASDYYRESVDPKLDTDGRNFSHNESNGAITAFNGPANEVTDAAQPQAAGGQAAGAV